MAGIHRDARPIFVVFLSAVLLAQPAAPAAGQAGLAPASATAAGAGPAAAAEASPFELTVPAIMRGPELVGTPPSQLRWSDDGRWLYFRWKPGGRPWHEPPALYRVPAGGGAPERLAEPAADSLAPILARGDVSIDERRRVVAHQGDLYLIDRRTMAVRRLTDTRSAASAPVFSHDGRAVYFVQEDNLFSLQLVDGAIRQHTDVRRGPATPEQRPEGLRALLDAQQLELFEALRLRAEREEEARRRREAREADRPAPLHLAREERVTAIAVERGGRHAVLHAARQPRDARQTIVPDYVTRSGYTQPRDVRAKVGDAQAEARLALVTLATGEARWLELKPPDAGDARLAAVRFIGWNEAGTTGLIAAVAYDFKEQRLYALDGATGGLTLLARDRDEAWIGGPCATWTAAGCAGWLPDGRGAYFVSERSGHSHLYTVPAAGGEARALTGGTWEVQDVELAPDRRHFLLTTSEGSPYELHLWRMPVGGGERTRLTGPAGRHSGVLSPDGRRLALVHSRGNVPPELYLADARPGAPVRRVTDSPTAAWRAHPWIDPEIIEFPARDGALVPARIYRPRDVGAAANGAAVIFVHGAGYLQNVHRGWSSYFREYMFHHLLAERGFTVLDIDFRGSAGHGRDWRTAIYRHMGDKDLTDQVDGARWLARHEGVDPARVGIYGGSYGGFITLMALFTEPDHFAAGAALRAVTDWAHYNHWYTSRILNLPQGDTLAYRRSSPIYFAEGLRAPLLITHGMVDVNVHFQDVVRLAQRLIELGKTDWELAVYPVEDHGFQAPSSWTDQYRRILELFERHLQAPPTTTTSEES
jgi:dipeptidyl aminopeptidase/acylaminoacyl peptidase